jgi:hypothetical protein
MKKVTIELDFGNSALAALVEAGSGGVDVGQLLRDALGEFADVRSPAEEYVAKRYTSFTGERLKFKVNEVKKRIQMARTLACADVTILVDSTQEEENP